MKIIFRCLVLLFCINLVGCIGTANRLWNSGPYISKAYKKASDECFQKAIKVYPPLPEPVHRGKEWDEYNYKTEAFSSKCMKEKGF